MYTYVHMHVCACACVHVYVCMCVCVYVCVCLYVCIHVWCCLSDCLHRGSPLCECWYSMSYLFDVVFSPQNLRATQPTHLFSTTTSIFHSLLNATPGRLNEVVVPLSPTDQNPSARPPDSKCICAIVLVARLAQVAVRGDGLWRHEQADQEERPQSLISRFRQTNRNALFTRGSQMTRRLLC